jgi:hypothetical protein
MPPARRGSAFELSDAIDLGGAFSASKTAALAEAKRSSQLKQIVKKRLPISEKEKKAAAAGQYRTPDGKPLLVERFKVTDKMKLLRDYGCPVAVNLYLRFQLECAGLFLVMFVLAIPDMASNYMRNEVRTACRALTHEDFLFASVTSASAAINGSECGWEGLGGVVRRNISASPTTLLFSLGACMEYTSYTDKLQPIANPSNGTAFVATPDASYCARSSDALTSIQFWLQFVNVLVFFAFLIRLRRVQRTAAEKLDRENWTAADYTVLVTGLDKGVPADDAPDGTPGLETKVRADLLSIDPTWATDRLVQVEVARECKGEVDALARMGRLRIREDELEAAIAKGKSTEKKKGQLEEVQREIADVREALEKFKEEPDETTGHAFVVFLYEKDRDKLVSRCRPRSCFRNRSPPVWTQSTAKSGGRKPMVEYAPEPDDIRWANLAVSNAARRWRTLQITGLLVVMVAIGAVANTLAKVWKAGLSQGGSVDFPMAEGLSEEEQEAWMRRAATAASVSTSLIPIVVNMVMKMYITKAVTGYEGNDTNTQHETSIFGKLSIAYTFNTVIIPIAAGMVFSLGVSGRPVNQAWYEPGGVVEEAISLIISNAIATDVLKVLQLGTLAARYVFARFVVSQQRLNQLWAPPQMNLGELYAASLKTCALCLLYAPLWPGAYLYTCVAMLFTYCCTKCAVAVWFRKPPMVSEGMMERMRSQLGMLMLLHTVVAAVGANAASNDTVGSALSMGAAANAPVVAMFLLWGVYELINSPALLNTIPFLRLFDAAEKPDIAFMWSDVGQRVVIERLTVKVDGKVRSVKWPASTTPYDHPISGKIKSVEEKEGGKVELTNGTKFRNPMAGEIPYLTHDIVTNAGKSKTILGVEDRMGYQVDQYICPTARPDFPGKPSPYTTEFLIQRVFRDFGVGKGKEKALPQALLLPGQKRKAAPIHPQSMELETISALGEAEPDTPMVAATEDVVLDEKKTKEPAAVKKAAAVDPSPPARGKKAAEAGGAAAASEEKGGGWSEHGPLRCSLNHELKPSRHDDYSCNVCGAEGTRYRCRNKPPCDYNVCKKCYDSAKEYEQPYPE